MVVGIAFEEVGKALDMLPGQGSEDRVLRVEKILQRVVRTASFAVESYNHISYSGSG